MDNDIIFEHYCTRQDSVVKIGIPLKLEIEKRIANVFTLEPNTNEIGCASKVNIFSNYSETSLAGANEILAKYNKSTHVREFSGNN